MAWKPALYILPLELSLITRFLIEIGLTLSVRNIGHIFVRKNNQGNEFRFTGKKLQLSE